MSPFPSYPAFNVNRDAHSILVQIEIKFEVQENWDSMLKRFFASSLSLKYSLLFRIVNKSSPQILIPE